MGQFDDLPEVFAAESIQGQVLANACRYFEFQVEELDESEERVQIHCQTLLSRELRPFWGFNRAKHAVLEAAILATRVNLLEHAFIADQIRQLEIIVEKTAGVQEKRAFARLNRFFRDQGVL